MSERDERERAYAAILEIADNLHKVGPEHADEARSVLHDAARILSDEPRPDLLEALRVKIGPRLEEAERRDRAYPYNSDSGPEELEWVLDEIARLREQQPEPVAVEVRYNEDGTVDEILGTGWLHMEQMDADLWWFGFHPEGRAGARMAWTICGRVCTITEPLAPCGPAETVG